MNRDLPVALGPSTLLISVGAATLGAPFLVSGFGQDRNATQYRPTTTAGLLSQSRLQGARHCNVRHPKAANWGRNWPDDTL